MNNLAGIYQAVGNLEQALKLSEEVVKLSKVKLGSDHPSTLMSMNNLAGVYSAVEKLEQALVLYEKTLKLQTATLGSEHPNTLMTMGNLAGAYLRDKQPEKALPLFDQFVTARRRRAKSDNPGFAGLLAAVCSLLLKHQQNSAAETYLRECLMIREKKIPNHWLYFNTKSMLGSALAGQQKFDEAEPLLLQGYEGMKQREAKISTPAKVRLTESLQHLVNLYTAWNKPKKAAEWQKKLDATKAKLQKQKKKSKTKKRTVIKKKKSDWNRDRPLIAPRPKLGASKPRG